MATVRKTTPAPKAQAPQAPPPAAPPAPPKPPQTVAAAVKMTNQAQAAASKGNVTEAKNLIKLVQAAKPSVQTNKVDQAIKGVVQTNKATQNSLIQSVFQSQQSAKAQANAGNIAEAERILAESSSNFQQYFKNQGTFTSTGPGTGVINTTSEGQKKFLSDFSSGFVNTQRVIEQNRPQPQNPPTIEEEVATPQSSFYSPPASSPPPPSPVLVPARDVVNFQTELPSAEAMALVLFEEIGGYELINLARRDTIDGQNPLYTTISNLSSIRREFNAFQIISLQKANQTNFERYEINLEERIPKEKYLLNNNISNFLYIANNGDLVIELDNMRDDEEIEIQMANSGKIT